MKSSLVFVKRVFLSVLIIIRDIIEEIEDFFLFTAIGQIIIGIIVATLPLVIIGLLGYFIGA